MKRLIKTLVLLILAVAVGLLAREYLAGVSIVSGESMNDTLATGDAVLITRFDYLMSTPERGDVVQLEVPGRDGLYLKRVIGLPGDCVEIIGGNVHVNGQVLYEPYATLSTDDFSITLGPDEYFMLGDNRPVSKDSRDVTVGAVTDIVGKARWILWPLDRIGRVK